ncbi:MAG: hypothetical protein IKA61_04095 [Clostridia bacterium]|nr:hypothetical protein [Clostridia bacterium]
MQDNQTAKSQEKKTEPAKKQATYKKKKSANEDFKRKYFEYYDDIKISDRQDW